MQKEKPTKHNESCPSGPLKHGLMNQKSSSTPPNRTVIMEASLYASDCPSPKRKTRAELQQMLVQAIREVQATSKALEEAFTVSDPHNVDEY